jgi:hypothetical protein
MRRRIIALLLVALILSASEAWTQGRDRRSRRASGPVLKVGDEAPDFELPHLDQFLKAQADGKDTSKLKAKTVKLSSLRGGKPVVLLFSSYT